MTLKRRGDLLEHRVLTINLNWSSQENWNPQMLHWVINSIFISVKWLLMRYTDRCSEGEMDLFVFWKSESIKPISEKKFINEKMMMQGIKKVIDFKRKCIQWWCQWIFVAIIHHNFLLIPNDSKQQKTYVCVLSDSFMTNIVLILNLQDDLLGMWWYFYIFPF